jgi:adenylate cyclase
MSSISPLLLITDASGQQNTYPLGEALTWRIGRGKSSNIMLLDDGASRRHAIIQRTEMGEYYLMDSGSQNGTFVKGRRVTTPIVLNDGDEISIGAHRLVFRNPTPAIGLGGMYYSEMEDTSAATRVLFAEKLVTVLVVDIRDFTHLTQNVDQEVLCKFISQWFSDASEIFRARGSWALKYIGDAVMAAWLHEPGREREQILSVLAAVSQFAEVSSGPKYALPFRLSFGAGLNTGIASVGNAGSGTQTDYSAFGDSVNAAFRIESSTRQIGLDVALGHRTAELLGKDLVVSRYFRDHLLHLKGYDIPQGVWAGSFEDLRRLLADLES